MPSIPEFRDLNDGWYYLLATHDTYCRGADSGCNIRVGRSLEAPASSREAASF